MAEKKFVFYPVDNGQAMRLVLDEKTNLLFDIKQKTDAEDKSDKTWDVRGSLLKDLPLRGERTFLSVFCLSHADLDHCQGFGETFFLPEQNGDVDTEEETLIQIDELWVTAQIFNEEYKAQAEKVQKEARRRLKLWSDPKKLEKAKKPGNQIVVFGRFDDEKGIKNLPDSRHVGAGETFSNVCGEKRDDFEMFIHWPFKSAVDDKEMPRNEVSLVAQLSVHYDGNIAKLLMGGDAGCAVWETVYNISKKNKNLEHLEWDVFLIPHHGTYKFFTKKEHEEGRHEAEHDPEKTSMDILDSGEKSGWLICSSRPVKELNYDDELPPHIEGIKHYRETAKNLGNNDHFVCLMEYPDKKSPKPFEFRLTGRGLQKEYASGVNILTGAGAISQTRRWG